MSGQVPELVRPTLACTKVSDLKVWCPKGRLTGPKFRSPVPLQAAFAFGNTISNLQWHVPLGLVFETGM